MSNVRRRSVLAALSGLPLLGALSAVASARTTTEISADPMTGRHLSTAIINGQPVVFDMNDINLKEGDMAVGFDWEGNLVVQPVTVREWDFEDGYRPGGVRLVRGPLIDRGSHRSRSTFFAIGKVIA